VYNNKYRRSLCFRPAIRVIGPSIAYIPLTRGYFSLVDAANADSLEQFSWTADPHDHTTYAKYGVYLDRKRITVKMHRAIVYVPGMSIDHIDGNGLNNMRYNLRPVTDSQNNTNSAISRSNKSGFKGVFFCKQKRKWRAMIQLNGKKTHLGLFSKPEVAHEAYKKAAESLHGEFRRAS